MKLVNVSLTSVKMLEFRPRDMAVELAVSFDDGKPRNAKFRIASIDADATAAEIFSRLRKYEQGLHRDNESETVLDSIVSINFTNYRETFEKLNLFLARAAEKIELLKSGKSDKYISTIIALNSMKAEF